jgi:hypothetical protein
MVALELFEVAEGHLLLEGADRAADFRPSRESTQFGSNQNNNHPRQPMPSASSPGDHVR